jgi:hypothetical protein
MKFLVFFLWIALVGSWANVASAQPAQSASFEKRQSVSSSFRIDVDLYQDETKPPVLQFQTYFTPTKTIEYSDQSRTVVLDTAAGSVLVLDPKKRTVTEVDLSWVESQLGGLLSHLEAQNRESMQASEPIWADGSQLTLENAQMAYRVVYGSPADPEMASRYAAYANCSAKLAAVFPPHKPPQLRLLLNQLLEDKRLLPMETRRVTKTKGAEKLELVARLLVKESLDATDQIEVNRILKMTQEFRIVSSREFYEVK